MSRFDNLRDRIAVVSLLALSLVAFSVSASRGASGMAHRSEARRVMLNVSSAEGAYLQEVHSISFEPGINRVRVRLDSGNFEPGSFLFVPGTPDVRVRRTSFLDNRTVLVVLESDVDSIQSVTLYARLRGLSNHSSYSADMGEERERLRLREEITLFNRSGQSFEDAWLGVGFGSWLKTTLKAGSEKRIRIYEKESVPVSVRYQVVEAGRQLDNEFTALPVHYVFRNTSESNLGDRALRKGKIRFYNRGSGSPSVFLGEARVSHTPVGDTVDLAVGKSNEVRAKRAVVERRQTNVRRNDHRRIQLYDEVFTLKYTIENNTERPARVRLLETMTGEWELVDASHDVGVPSNSVLRVTPTVPAGSTETVRVTVKTLNNMPDQP